MPPDFVMNRVFLIANGEPDLPLDWGQHQYESDRIICADGGSKYLDQLGFRKNAKSITIVGDLDSSADNLIVELESQGATIKRFPREKDASDLELAISEALAVTPLEEIICIAMLGGRPDHALANVTLLSRFAERNVKIKLIGANWQAQFVTRDQPLRFEGKTNDVLSIVPLSAVIENVSARGLKWPLKNARLEWGNSLTISNEFESDVVEVEVEKGTLLVFHFVSG